MTGTNNPVREARARAGERFATIADELERVPPRDGGRLIAGLAHWSIQAGEVLAECVENHLIAVRPGTLEWLKELREDDQRRATIPPHTRWTDTESMAALGDWRVRFFSDHAANHLGDATLGSFGTAREMGESQCRLVWGERARSISRMCRRMARDLCDHPTLNLLSSLSDLHNESANGRLFHEIAHRRAEALRLHQNHLESLGRAADQRANAKASRGESIPMVFAEYEDVCKASASPLNSDEPPELTRAGRDIVRRAGLCCARGRIALRAGGAASLDATTQPNATGQPRSVELHAKLQELDGVCVALEVGLSDPRYLIDGAAERFTRLAGWFGEKRDELGAVVETQGLEAPQPESQAEQLVRELIRAIPASDTGTTTRTPDNESRNSPREVVVMWEGAEHSKHNVRLARTRSAYLEAHGNVAAALEALRVDGFPVARSTFYNHLNTLDESLPGWRTEVMIPTKVDKSDALESGHITRNRRKAQGN